MRERRTAQTIATAEEMLVKRIAAAAEPFNSIDTVDLRPLLERVDKARIVLLGEATHGTHLARANRQEGIPFYRHRGRLAGCRACR